MLPQAAVSRAGADGWSGAGAMLTLTGGAGNKAVQYALGDGAWTGYTGPVPLPAGTYPVRYRAQGDNLIYSGPEALAVKVDPEAPVPAVSVTSSRRSSTVTLSAQDAVSGVQLISYRLDGAAWAAYSGPFKVKGKGLHLLTYRALDYAGNYSTPRVARVRVR
jgi:hypothetical protein